MGFNFNRAWAGNWGHFLRAQVRELWVGLLLVVRDGSAEAGCSGAEERQLFLPAMLAGCWQEALKPC